MKRRAYTLLETVIVLLIISITITITFQIIININRGYYKTEKRLSQSTSSMTVIRLIERALDGCQSVSVEPDVIVVRSSRGDSIIAADGFKNVEELRFEGAGSLVNVYIGGEQYCIPITLEE